MNPVFSRKRMGVRRSLIAAGVLTAVMTAGLASSSSASSTPAQYGFSGLQNNGLNVDGTLYVYRRGRHITKVKVYVQWLTTCTGKGFSGLQGAKSSATAFAKHKTFAAKSGPNRITGKVSGSLTRSYQVSGSVTVNGPNCKYGPIHYLAKS